MKILYEARGQEIERLKNEISILANSKTEKIRQLQHENLLLEGKNKRLEAESNQIQTINEENRNLRQEIYDLKNKLKQSEVLRQELDNSNQLVQQLQIQISDLQKSDAMSKLRREADERFRSLQDITKKTQKELEIELGSYKNKVSYFNKICSMFKCMFCSKL